MKFDTLIMAIAKFTRLVADHWIKQFLITSWVLIAKKKLITIKKPNNLWDSDGSIAYI